MIQDKTLAPGTKIETEIPVLITSDELSRLTMLGQSISSSKLTELDEIFSAILTADRGYSFNLLTPYLNPVEQLFYHMSWEVGTHHSFFYHCSLSCGKIIFNQQKIAIMTGVVVAGVAIWMMAVGKSGKRIMLFLYLILFIAGLAINWWKMYQVGILQSSIRCKIASIYDIGFLFRKQCPRDSPR